MPYRSRLASIHLCKTAVVGLLAATTIAALAPAARAQTPQRPAITGVAFARFYETDPAAAQHFYAGTLGLPHLTRGNLAEYPVNASQWIETVPHTGPKPNDRLAAVGFTTRNAAALQQYLAAKGYPAAEPLRDNAFAVRDPEGNLIYFVQQDSNFAVARAALSSKATAHRIIHVGFVVHDAAKENVFWRDTLGFKPLWHGGMSADRTDWVSQQVPDGTDWLEYMLNTRPDADLQTIGVMNHVSLGAADMSTVIAALKANGCTAESCSASKMGRDGKIQLNLRDPDLTRIEFMEFTPRQQPCCSPITGPAPTEAENR